MFARSGLMMVDSGLWFSDEGVTRRGGVDWRACRCVPSLGGGGERFSVGLRSSACRNERHCVRVCVSEQASEYNHKTKVEKESEAEMNTNAGEIFKKVNKK